MNLKTLLSSSDQDQLCLKVPATQTVPQTPVKTFLAALLKTRPATSPCVIAGLKSDPDAQLCKSSQTNLRQSAAELLQAPAGYRMEAVTSHDGGCMRIRSSKIQLREFFFFLFLFCWCCFALVGECIALQQDFLAEEDFVRAEVERARPCWRSFQHCLCKAWRPFCALFCLFSLVGSGSWDSLLSW